MSALLWSGACILGGFLLAALGDLVSEEIRGWLDLVPQGVLRLAAARLDPDSREFVYEEEWLPELVYALRGAEARPITRLIRGTKFAFGLLVSAHKIEPARSYGLIGPITLALRSGTERIILVDGMTEAANLNRILEGMKTGDQVIAVRDNLRSLRHARLESMQEDASQM